MLWVYFKGVMQSLWNRAELCDSGVVGVFQWSTIVGAMQGLLQKKGQSNVIVVSLEQRAGWPVMSACGVYQCVVFVVFISFFNFIFINVWC